MAKILLVDDELTMVQMVAEVLRNDGHEVFPFTTPNGVFDALTKHQPDLVITDLYLDKTKPHGMEIIQKARALNPPATVIMITGFVSVESSVEAMRLGAFDYLPKPFKLGDLKFRVQRALEHASGERNNPIEAVVQQLVAVRKRLHELDKATYAALTEVQSRHSAQTDAILLELAVLGAAVETLMMKR
jgi:DNA-binding NtrC family response regulator